MKDNTIHITWRRMAYFAVTMCCIVLAGCELDKECRQDMRVRMGVSAIGDSLKLSEDSITYVHDSYSNVGPITIHGLDNDSLIADSAYLGTVYMPLKKDTDTSRYVIAFDDAEDTLTVVYERQESFVSLACGCAVFATIDTVMFKAEKIDSIKVINSNVTTQKETHITLFVHKD